MNAHGKLGLALVIGILLLATILYEWVYPSWTTKRSPSDTVAPNKQPETKKEDDMLMDHSGRVYEDYQVMVDPYVMPIPTPEEPEEFTEYMKLAREREIQAEHPGCIMFDTKEQGEQLAQALSEGEDLIISKEVYDCLRGVVKTGRLAGVIKEVIDT